MLRSSHACFGGTQHFLEADSVSAGPMRYGVFVPPSPTGASVTCLAGLTCTEETFAIKAGAQRVAAQLGLTLITSDTSARCRRVPGDDDAWDFGQGAGFYVDATTPAFTGWNLEQWVAVELPALVAAAFGLDPERAGILGHSMGGHGALTLALKHPTRYRSASAFAPICAPSEVPWGQKAFAGYLGDDRAAWAAHDTTQLVTAGRRFSVPPLIDQGLADSYLDAQLRPDRLEAACAVAGQPLTLRRHPGYDHGYWFIQSFVEDHLRFHAAHLS